jgi:hypothetical protein
MSTWENTTTVTSFCVSLFTSSAQYYIDLFRREVRTIYGWELCITEIYERKEFTTLEISVQFKDDDEMLMAKLKHKDYITDVFFLIQIIIDGT